MTTFAQCETTNIHNLSNFNMNLFLKILNASVTVLSMCLPFSKLLLQMEKGSTCVFVSIKQNKNYNKSEIQCTMEKYIKFHMRDTVIISIMNH